MSQMVSMLWLLAVAGGFGKIGLANECRMVSLSLLAETEGIKITVGIYFLRKYRLQVQESMRGNPGKRGLASGCRIEMQARKSNR